MSENRPENGTSPRAGEPEAIVLPVSSVQSVQTFIVDVPHGWRDNKLKITVERTLHGGATLLSLMRAEALASQPEKPESLAGSDIRRLR